MALRNIRTDHDEILRKKSKVVDEVNDRIKVLVKDMIETMYAAEGVGLAAPQVGILKRVAVVDVGEGVHVFINPEILEKEGACVGLEGCLSLPGRQGEVERPTRVKVKALNENGEEFILEAKDFFARAICHEIDHLDGILFIDKLVKSEGN
ncbi:peptide deformylase [Clostridium thermarum]|uniref:peptide deformylase n=1 Tax=Clostridium thermarum TaxID=1716543 RepID=UPI00111F482E|nr:peptide deformylase [Clostridium thermarum]